MGATENLYQAENTGELWMQSRTLWEMPAESREPNRWLREEEGPVLAGEGSVDWGPVP